jgi:hypothetical protein
VKQVLIHLRVRVFPIICLAVLQYEQRSPARLIRHDIHHGCQETLGKLELASLFYTLETFLQLQHQESSNARKDTVVPLVMPTWILQEATCS